MHPQLLGLTTTAHLSIKADGDVGLITAALEKFEEPVLISAVTGTFQIVVELQLKSLSELCREMRAIRGIPGVREVMVHIYEHIISSFFLGRAPDPHLHVSDVDIAIVNRLLRDGRANFADIAEVVGLSVSGCRTRVQRLLEAGVVRIGAIKQRSDMVNDLLFGIGVTCRGDDQAVIDIILASPGLEFVARCVGRFDLIATVEFGSLREFNLLISQVRALPTVTYCEQWLHTRIVREQYFRAVTQIHQADEPVASFARRS